MIRSALRRFAAVSAGAVLLLQQGVAVPGGAPEAFAFLSVQSGKNAVARWNPCAPITYRVNLAQAPPGSLPEVRTAIDRVAAATGLTFRYAGATDVIPARTPADYPEDTQLIIAWSPEIPTADGGIGIGGATYVTGQDEQGQEALVIDRAMVVLDATATATMARGFGAAPEATTGQLLMHELGHAVGLAHPLVDDPDEIMYYRLTVKPANWGAGDLQGLHDVGAAKGCLTVAPALL